MEVEAVLGGSLVTTAWRVLRLRMEGTAYNKSKPDPGGN
jgi:hypothetical protein